MHAEKVFLLDNDPRILRAFTRVFEQADFDVQAFQSAEEFLIHHDFKTPGCAVLDVGLGTRNGLDVLRELACSGQMRPTIFISGRDDIASRVQAMKLGAIDFLTKPIEPTALLEAVRRGIERDRKDREQGAKLVPIGERPSNLGSRD